MPARSFILLTIICFVWALNVVVSKVVIDTMGVPPMFYAAARSLVVLAVLFPWLRPIPANLLRIAIVTLSVSGGAFALLFLGLRYSSPASAAVVNLLGAPLTVVFAILILKEVIGWKRGVGIGLTFLGVGVAIASPSGMQGSFGLIFVGLSAALGAWGSVLLKRIDVSPRRLQAWAGLTSTVVLFPLSFATESQQVHASVAAGWPFVAALLFSAVIVSVLAHTAYFKMLKDYDANLIAPLTLMTPMMTIALGAWLTDDPVGPFLVAGAVIAASGVLVIMLRPSRLIPKSRLVRARL
ncbi:DMT family transporter [Stakelama marina]|uniref:DMT family transporter n=1 Tax=Stakelama marina TaxID=2826939 RepID=A0A8T4IFU3_9SPHN|nr:DMT family transporter [Stakelama marina]MBR0553878.1 DMT family transporter [Stakelama marina]